MLKYLIRISNSLLLTFILAILIVHLGLTAVDEYDKMHTDHVQNILALETAQIEAESKEAQFRALQAASEAKERVIRVKQDELECMTKTIYYEAANESFEGRMAIAQVILNRTRDKQYPNTVCGVIYQKADTAKGPVYQFSWAGQEHDPSEINQYTWEEARYIARKALTNKVAHAKLAADKCEWYHADYVNPKWNLVKIAKIGHHIFYKA
jgi:spore germination cell wall hydrolase CwlJ-like protein